MRLPSPHNSHVYDSAFHLKQVGHEYIYNEAFVWFVPNLNNQIKQVLRVSLFASCWPAPSNMHHHTFVLGRCVFFFFYPLVSSPPLVWCSIVVKLAPQRATYIQIVRFTAPPPRFAPPGLCRLIAPPLFWRKKTNKHRCRCFGGKHSACFEGEPFSVHTHAPPCGNRVLSRPRGHAVGQVEARVSVADADRLHGRRARRLRARRRRRLRGGGGAGGAGRVQGERGA